ncbi:MAG: transglycosylase SLT domain-containing protein [Sedimenticola sp.]|nr:transglycosylase SLT domain-containing protein [Sedimenticola sp.]
MQWSGHICRLFPLACLLLISSSALGAASLEQQRSDFLKAERALVAGDTIRYEKLSGQLKSYPLYPYLEYRKLLQQIDSLDSSRVERFLSSYADSPLAWRLRQKWLLELARRERWWTYLVFYKPKMGSTLQCHYLTALLETGKTRQALDRAEAVWLHGRSRPEACDTILETWIEAGELTPELAWQRVSLAMQASQGGLANYLKRFLSDEQKQWLAAWRDLQRHPERITQPQPALASSPSLNRITLDAFTRLTRRDSELALKAWPALRERLDKSGRYQAQRALLRGLIASDHPQRLARLDTFTPNNSDHGMHESRLRAALKEQDWTRLLKWIDTLPPELKGSDRWRYWRARALAESGQQEAAESLLREVAEERSYHGFLAADRLNLSYRYDDNAIDLEQAGIDRLARKPGLLRARELFQIGRYIDARREWRMVVGKLNRLDLKRVSKLAQSWGWHDRAIFTLARTGYWDDLVLRFPLEHQALVRENSSASALDSAWVFAVIRQESAFSPDAHSPAGAMGLMQLMPATARFIARKEKLKPPRRSQLVRPELNIRLGTAYLNHVFRKLGEHQVLATAAYNAGPHRVVKWLPEHTLPADIWVELIPYNETRRYTERVLSYAAIYDQRMQRPLQRLASRMPPVRPRGQLASREVSEKNAAL